MLVPKPLKIIKKLYSHQLATVRMVIQPPLVIHLQRQEPQIERWWWQPVHKYGPSLNGYWSAPGRIQMLCCHSSQDLRFSAAAMVVSCHLDPSRSQNLTANVRSSYFCKSVFHCTPPIAAAGKHCSKSDNCWATLGSAMRNTFDWETLSDFQGNHDRNISAIHPLNLLHATDRIWLPVWLPAKSQSRGMERGQCAPSLLSLLVEKGSGCKARTQNKGTSENLKTFESVV